MSQQTPKNRVLFVRRFTATLLVLFGVFSLLLFNLRSPRLAQAATSSTINFQARLETASGAIAPDGNYNVEFKLYSASSGGTALWTEDWLNSGSHGIHTSNGYLSASLGSVTAFPTTINWDQPLWITMNIGGTNATCTPFTSCSPDGEMSPRLALTAVPYAFRAGQLATSNAASTYTSTLGIQAPTGGNQTFQLQDQGAAGTYNLLTMNAATGITTLGTPSSLTGKLALANSGSAYTVTLSSAAETVGNATITIPNTAGANDTVCLVTLANCIGVAGGGIGGSGTASTIAMFTGSGYTIGNSIMSQTGTTIGVAGTLQATTVNANTVQTNGTQRIDSSGNFTGGTINTDTLNSTSLTFSGAGATTISSAATQALTVTGGSTLTLQSTTTSAVTLDSGTTGAVNIGTNANAKTVTIGNASGATSIVLNAGTGAVNIGTNAVAHTTTVGSITGAATTTIQAGTGGINLTGAVSASSFINAVSGYKYNGTAGVTATCSGGQFLQNQVVQGGITTGGTCAAGGGGITTVGTFSGSSQVNGASISGSTITFGPADGTNPGMVSTGNQSFAGTKTFTGGATVATTSTTAFQIQNTGGASTLLTADTQNSQIILKSAGTDATLATAAIDTAGGVNDFPSGWGAPAGWTLAANSATHASGSATALASTWTPTVGITYQVSYAYSSCLGVTMTVSLGGQTLQNDANCLNNTQVVTVATAAPLTFTPASNWTGTVTNVKVQAITQVGPVLTVQNNGGTPTLQVRSSGDPSNIFIGMNSGSNNTSSGVKNTAVGASALQSNTSGYKNSAFGAITLQSNTTGYDNTASGYAALQYNTTGYDNTASGYAALWSNTIGSSNTAYGSRALMSNINGGNNAAFGASALQNNTGTYNAGLGAYSLQSNTTGSFNTAAGILSMNANTSGSANTGIGFYSLNNTTTGSNNTGVGVYSFINNTTGSNNTALGYHTGYQDANGNFTTAVNLQNATAIGAFAQVQANNTLVLGSVDNATQVVVGATVPIGTNSFGVSPVDLNSTTVTASQTSGSGTITASAAIFSASNVGEELVWADGTSETITGYTSSTVVTGSSTTITETNSYFRTHHIGFQVSSTGNVGVGTANPAYALDVAGDINTSGYYRQAGQIVLNANTNNTSVGVNAGSSYTTSYGSTALGSGALKSTTTGPLNTAIGGAALQSNTTGFYNTAVGANALQASTTGYSNVAVGMATLYTNTTGYNNSTLGTYGLYYNTTGINNVAIGYSSLLNNTTGSGNLALGYNTGNQDLNGKFKTLATLQNATAIGAYAQVQANNSIVLGSVDNATKVGIGITVPSNTFSVSPLDYQTGTVTRTNGSAVLAGTGTTWTSTMVGDIIVFADGTTNTVASYTSATSITMGTTYTGATDASPVYYRFHKVGFQVSNTGNVGIGTVSPQYAVDVTGDINTSTQYRIGGITLCTINGCLPVAGSGSYIQNQSAATQSANFNIQGAAGTATMAVQGASGGGDIADFRTGAGTLTTYIGATGNVYGPGFYSGTLDSNGSSTLNIGTNYATSVNIGNTANNITTTINGTAVIKPTTGHDSTTAFQVQNASGGAILTANTSANSVSIGGVLNINQVSYAAAPTVAIGAAGSLTGTYYYAVTFVTANGETNISPIGEAGPVSPAAQQVNLTDIPTGPAGLVTARKIYRSTGYYNTFNLVGTINDNVTTIFTDNNASPGVAAPGMNQTGYLSQNGQSLLVSDAVKANTFVGTAQTGSPYLNVTGNSNTSLGSAALNVLTTGNSNTAVGSNALFSTNSGSNNVALGTQAMQSNSTGSFNSGIGMGALLNNTTGANNVALGSSALYNNQTGVSNTGIGYNVLNTNTTGSYNTALGYNVNVGANNLQSATAIGANSYVTQSNSLILGCVAGTNSCGNTTYIGIGNTAPAALFSVGSTSQFQVDINGNFMSTGGTGTLKTTSTTAFSVQNASSVSYLNVDTSAGTITLGNAASGNYIQVTGSGGLTAYGTSRHVRTLNFSPEYAGAVLSGATCSANSSGTMTSGNDGTFNYYQWTNTLAASQCYDIVVEGWLPSDFAGWASTATDSISTWSSSAASGQVSIKMLDMNLTTDPAVNGVDVSPSASSTWYKNTIPTPTGSYAAGQPMHFTIHLTAPQNVQVRVGNISLNYYSNY